MPVPSLTQLARKSCIKNVNSITDVGDAEYDLLRPVLLRLQNPKQLYELEQICPQIIGADAEIWKQFCKRDIPNYEKNPQEPSNPKSWYKCYLKLYKAGQHEIDADAAMLKATMDGIKTKQEKNKAQLVEIRGVKVPADLKKNYPTIAPPKGSAVYRGMGRAREYSREPAKAVSTLAKIRKETAAQSHFTVAKRSQPGIFTRRDMTTKAIPTKTTIIRAPKALIEEHQKAKISEPIDPTIQPAAVFNPKKRRIEHVEPAEPDPTSRDAREKRLKALTQSSGARSISSSTADSTVKANTPPREDSTTAVSHRKELAKANSPRPLPTQSRSAANSLTPDRANKGTIIRAGSPIARAKSSSPLRTPMRIHRNPSNPLMVPKRRPSPRA